MIVRPKSGPNVTTLKTTANVAGVRACQDRALSLSNPMMHGRDVTGEWTIDELQDLLDEWLIVGW